MRIVGCRIYFESPFFNTLAEAGRESKRPGPVEELPVWQVHHEIAGFTELCQGIHRRGYTERADEQVERHAAVSYMIALWHSLTPLPARMKLMCIQKYMGVTLRRHLPYNPYAFEFGEPQELWIASKTGGLSGVRTEAGLIHTARAEWAICVCTRDYPSDEPGSDCPGSRFIGEVSRELFDAWG